MSTLLEGMSEEYLEGQGRKLGDFHPRDFLTVLGIPISPSSFPIFLEYLAKYAFWFRLDRSEHGNEVIYHLKSDLGWRWTKFLMGYMQNASKSVFETPITASCTEFSVTLKVRLKPFDQVD